MTDPLLPSDQPAAATASPAVAPRLPTPPADQPAATTENPAAAPRLPTTETSPLDGTTADPGAELRLPTTETSLLDGTTADPGAELRLPTTETSPLDGATADPGAEPRLPTTETSPLDGATADPTAESSVPLTETSPPPDRPRHVRSEAGIARFEARVARIAATLHEHAPIPLKQIRRILEVLGYAATKAVVAEVLQIEANGGMLIVSGTCRRTLGGIFFFLVRPHLSPKQQHKIFPFFGVRSAQARAKLLANPPAPVAPPPPRQRPPPPNMWDDREALIAGLQATHGTVSSAKVTLIGRPTRVSEQSQFTLLTLSDPSPLPALPRGVPLPSASTLPPTTYSVFVGKKQWKQVAAALSTPEDMLIIEGVQLLDATAKTIAIFAMKTTTKLLQQASRPPKRSK